MTPAKQRDLEYLKRYIVNGESQKDLATAACLHPAYLSRRINLLLGEIWTSLRTLDNKTVATGYDLTPRELSAIIVHCHTHERKAKGGDLQQS